MERKTLAEANDLGLFDGNRWAGAQHDTSALAMRTAGEDNRFPHPQQIAGLDLVVNPANRFTSGGDLVSPKDPQRRRQVFPSSFAALTGQHLPRLLLAIPEIDVLGIVEPFQRPVVPAALFDRVEIARRSRRMDMNVAARSVGSCGCQPHRAPER